MKKLALVLVLVLVMTMTCVSAFAETMVIMDTTGEEPVVWKEVDGVAVTGEFELTVWEELTFEDKSVILDYDFNIDPYGTVDRIIGLVSDPESVYLIERLNGEMGLYLSEGSNLTIDLIKELLEIGFTNAEVKTLFDEKLRMTKDGVITIYQKLVGYEVGIYE